MGSCYCPIVTYETPAFSRQRRISAGNRLEGFAGIRPKSLGDGITPDGLLAHQSGLILDAVDASLTDEMRLQRTELEKKLEVLNAQRAKLGDAKYYSQLEAIMLEIAKLYEGKR